MLQLGGIRSDMFARLVPLAPDGLRGTRGGDLLARLAGDVDELQDYALRVIQPLVSAGIVAVLSVAGVFLLLPEAAAGLLLALVAAFAVGALVTGALFTLGKMLIGWYLGTSGVASSYGAAASLITILLWIYYSSLILLFGAEFTKAYAELRGSRRHIRANRSAAAVPGPDLPSWSRQRHPKRGNVTAPSNSSDAGHRR